MTAAVTVGYHSRWRQSPAHAPGRYDICVSGTGFAGGFELVLAPMRL
jgi:hypothetical protein